jgi:hypothetical protein
VLALLAGVLPPAPVQAFVVDQYGNFPVVLGTGRVQFGSPTLADLDGNGTLEIIAGTIDGKVIAVDHTGQQLWAPVDASTAVNQEAQRAPGAKTATEAAPIRSTPAVADLDGDGDLEIVVGVGGILRVKAHGGVVVIDKDGNILPGWPQATCDFWLDDTDPNETDPFSCPDPAGGNGYTNGVVSSPAIGDIDGDGEPEIVYGAFDQYIYARNADGTLVPGWPRWVMDTVWSSPALADMDGDGVNEVVIGVDSHDYTGYERSSEKGGELYVLDGDATILAKANQSQMFNSSPALANLDSDPTPEIVIGSGTYYSGVGKYVSRWDYDPEARSLSLYWRKTTGAQMPGSPAIGDVNGDGKLDVVIGGHDSNVYALAGETTATHASGAALWVKPVRTLMNGASTLESPVLADYDGDGVDDVFISITWEVGVLRGRDGAQFTARAFPSDSPSYYGDYLATGAPAIGDLNGDGRPELVSAAANKGGGQAQINVWSLPTSKTSASWPQFKLDAANTSALLPGSLAASISEVRSTVSSRMFTTHQIELSNTGAASNFTWSVTKEDPQGLVQFDSATGNAGTPLSMTIMAPEGVAPGTYEVPLTVRAEGLTELVIPVYVEVIESRVQSSVPQITVLKEAGSGQSNIHKLRFSSSDGSDFAWTITENDPLELMILDRLEGAATDELNVTVAPPTTLVAGTYEATITLGATATVGSSAPFPSVDVPVQVIVVDELQQLYLPILQR